MTTRYFHTPEGPNEGYEQKKPQPVNAPSRREITARRFDLGDILTVTTGRLVSPSHIDGAYVILNFMTGDNLFTHQLPRAAGACEGPLLEQHPQLANVLVPDFNGTTRDELQVEVMAWLDSQKAVYGDTLPVAPLSEWHHMNPLQELAEMTETPDRIISVVLP